jgi:DNA-binding winged helix-turn-helix (wHTH) protein
VTGSAWQFGPFVADRLRYRVVRGDTVVELTPKLLDLLFHLVDRPGTLVTKEELLDALWPDANVTDNALTQAVSELRQALGDDAGDPQFIKTVARRGYRFIAQVAPMDATAAPPSSPASRDTFPPAATSDAIAVMDFKNVTGDADSAWLSAGIAETVTSDLRALGRYRVVDRGRVASASRRAS